MVQMATSGLRASTHTTTSPETMVCSLRSLQYLWRELMLMIVFYS